MKLSRRALYVALIVGLNASAFAVVAWAADPPAGPKLYRWVGADGKVHYSDDLPPEALTQARQELSKNTGMTLRDVSRALTPEERAAAEAKADSDAKAAEALAKINQNDQMLVNSYPSEDDLKRAYGERIGMQLDGLKTIRMGLDNQQKSLASFLYAASAKELAGKPVDAYLTASIARLHDSIVAQQQSQTQTEAQLANLRQEGDATLAHYRQLRAAAASAHSDSGTQAPAASPPKG